MVDACMSQQHALDACLVIMAVCGGGADRGVGKTSRDAVRDFLGCVAETKSDELLALLDLYDRFDAMRLQGGVAAFVRSSIEAELDFAFTGRRFMARQG